MFVLCPHKHYAARKSIGLSRNYYSEVYCSVRYNVNLW